MRLLICNDDGITSPGIVELAQSLEHMGVLSVVAPDSERSAQSHALTMSRPLRARSVGENRWAVSGTPVDCIYLATHHLLEEEPDIVVSGINKGANLGHDIYYSGTFAAAMEGALRGIPSIAVSLDGGEGATEWHWSTASFIVRRVVEAVVEHGMPHSQVLNVNVPNIPLTELKGLATAKLGHRQYDPVVIAKTDLRGQRYFWIGGNRQRQSKVAGSDCELIHEGWATVTPVHADRTHYDGLDSVRQWTDC